MAGCRVVPVDMGMKEPGPIPGVLDRRLGDGTGDITQGPAHWRWAACRASSSLGSGVMAAKSCWTVSNLIGNPLLSILLRRPDKPLRQSGPERP